MENLDKNGSWDNSTDGTNEIGLAQAWRPPGNLTLEKIDALGPVVWLSDAIDIMAFGGEPPECEVTSDGRPNFGNILQRCRSAKALFNAAHAGAVECRGTLKEGGDVSDPIDKSYFQMPRALGCRDNSIETDQLSVSGETLEAFWRGEHKKWWNVTVDSEQFAAWLKQSIGGSLRNNEPRGRRGRPPEYDWEKIEGKVCEWMDYYGEFFTGDKDWNAQARLEEKIKEYCTTEFGREPTDSTLRDHLPAILKKWRERGAA